jgi:hypothetical protein
MSCVFRYSILKGSTEKRLNTYLIIFRENTSNAVEATREPGVGANLIFDCERSQALRLEA